VALAVAAAHLLASCGAIFAAGGGADAGYPSLPRQVDEPPPPSPRFTALTLNVQRSAARADLRGPALLALLAESDADVVALQEVSPWVLDLLDDTGWVLEHGYAAVAGDGRPLAEGGVVLLSRHPVLDAEVLAIGRHGALAAELLVHDTPVTVVAVHLASPLGHGDVRARQLVEVFARASVSPDSLVLGDFNFGDGERPESSTLPPEYTDAWLILRPGDPGYTWDRERNPWAFENSFDGEESRRLDRILVRGGLLAPTDVELVADTPLADDRFPSDHFGVRTVFRKFGEEPAGRE
jgi:poly(A) polymerase